MLLMIIKAIVEKHPNNVAEFFPQLCDDRVFTPDLMHWTSGIIGCIGGLNEVYLIIIIQMDINCISSIIIISI